MLSVRTAARRLASTSSRRWQHHASTTNLNAPTAEDVAHFRTLLPESAVLSTLSPASANADDLEPFNVDWIGRYKGHARTVAFARRPHQDCPRRRQHPKHPVTACLGRHG